MSLWRYILRISAQITTITGLVKVMNIDDENRDCLVRQLGKLLLNRDIYPDNVTAAQIHLASSILSFK